MNGELVLWFVKMWDITMSNYLHTKIFKEVAMGGRFGKYGDAKRKAQTPKNLPKRRSHR